MTLWDLTLLLNDNGRQHPFALMYCEYIHKVLVGLVDTASGNPKDKKQIKKKIKTKAKQLQSILSIDITNNLNMIKILVKKLYKYSKWKGICITVNELGEIRLNYDEFVLYFTLDNDGTIKECRASNTIDSVLLYSKTPDSVFDNTKIFQFDQWLEELKYYHVNTNNEDTLTLDSRYEVGAGDATKDDVILRSYGRVVAHYLGLHQYRVYKKCDISPEGLSYIYRLFLNDIVEVTKTPKSELDTQIENFFKIVTHLVDNFPYKEVTIVYTDTRTVCAMFRTTQDEQGLLAHSYDISITVEADENGCIESITGIAYHKDGIVLYDKKDGLRPLENWWEVNNE